MASEHRHPTGEPGTGEVIETRRPRTEQDLVEDVADVSAEETGKTAEAEVGMGEMVQPPTPPLIRTEHSGRRSERTGRS